MIITQKEKKTIIIMNLLIKKVQVHSLSWIKRKLMITDSLACKDLHITLMTIFHKFLLVQKPLGNTYINSTKISDNDISISDIKIS